MQGDTEKSDDADERLDVAKVVQGHVVGEPAYLPHENDMRVDDPAKSDDADERLDVANVVQGHDVGEPAYLPHANGMRVTNQAKDAVQMSAWT